MESRYTLEPSIHGHDETPSNNTMAKPSSFRAVYKIEDSQEIDVDVYLPQSKKEVAPQIKCPICNVPERPTK
ncbi:hypothetical protein D7B24_005082 [Verticillium nonalfalfae]|uniref:Uncharacterized protein n=1 Tax=Verticillium nonalfalfae TaxID=1051616 RepID=A0A3M9YK67_9PEZI|nr:uncharacterized protein D7B24_005082 [Verticillium nonalfalfae]RNJ60993.1 hypothetical protein D7B24_005082 [Verticillium nonalfalfae]